MRIVPFACLCVVALAAPTQAEFVEVTPLNLDVAGWSCAWGRRSKPYHGC